MEVGEGYYQMHKDNNVPELRQEAEDLLLSLLVMLELLQKQGKTPLNLSQRYLIKTMYELLLQVLACFMKLYSIEAEEIKPYLQQDSFFPLVHITAPEQLQHELLDKLYQLTALNTLVVNELLEQFTETQGNILISLCQRSLILTRVMESLALFSYSEITPPIRTDIHSLS